MRSKAKHIDDVQPATVDEHFKRLIADKTPIDYGSKEVSFEDLPEWYDEKLFRAGQDYYRDNILGLNSATLVGLVAVFAIPTILDVLVWTKRSGSACTAYVRYFQTLAYVRAWYLLDIKDPDWYRTTNVIRLKHSINNRKTINAGLKGITHEDLALTQYGFIAYVLVRAKAFGLTNTPEQREGLVHFWRVVGHQIGISDKFNICRKNAAETTELCEKLMDQVYAKYFKEVPKNFMEMSIAMLDGMWAMDISVDTHAFMAFVYKMNGLQYHVQLGWYSWLNLKYRETVHMICGLPYIGFIVRGYFYYFISLNFWLLRHFPIVAWIKWGREKTRISMYPKYK